MAEQEKDAEPQKGGGSVESGFIRLVYGTVSGNGYNTTNMPFEEALRIFKNLNGGESGWVGKAYGGTQKETDKKQEVVEKKKPEAEKTEEMKSKTFLQENGVCKVAEIKKGSLSESETQYFNSLIFDYKNKFINSETVFDNILVNSRTTSSRGGSITTKFNPRTGSVSYDFYLNTSCLDESWGTWRDYKEDIEKKKQKIEEIKMSGDQFSQYRISSLENSIKDTEEKLQYKGFNSAAFANTREERLKSTLSHEMMHRIFNERLSRHSGVITPKQRELNQKVRDVYSNSMKNGNIKKITYYARTNSSEFLSEAFAVRELGYDIPKEIDSILDEVLNYKE